MEFLKINIHWVKRNIFRFLLPAARSAGINMTQSLPISTGRCSLRHYSQNMETGSVSTDG